MQLNHYKHESKFQRSNCQAKKSLAKMENKLSFNFKVFKVSHDELSKFPIELILKISNDVTKYFAKNI